VSGFCDVIFARYKNMLPSIRNKHSLIRLKFWLYKISGWLIFVFVPIASGTLLVMKQEVAIVASVIGTLLSLGYFLQKQKLEELRVFREIFKECNARYYQMNETLDAIAKKTDEVKPEEKAKVIDYLNLCGEQYLYYKLGYIEPSVWQAWITGMEAHIAAPNISSIWAIEKRKGSYYDLPL
jgi:hypothetical protein